MCVCASVLLLKSLAATESISFLTTDKERIDLLQGAMLEVKKFQSGKSASSHANKQAQMMGCVLFTYLCVNVVVNSI